MRKGNRRSGFAMLEVMIVITIFMAVSASLFASASAMHKRSVNNAAKEEADDIAAAALRLMAEEAANGNEAEDSAAGLLISGMSPRETELVAAPKDGNEAVSFPVTVWSERDGDNLILYARAVRNGQKRTISLVLTRQEEERLATPSSAGDGKWRPVKYERIEESGEQE